MVRLSDGSCAVDGAQSPVDERRASPRSLGGHRPSPTGRVLWRTPTRRVNRWNEVWPTPLAMGGARYSFPRALRKRHLQTCRLAGRLLPSPKGSLRGVPAGRVARRSIALFGFRQADPVPNFGAECPAKGFFRSPTILLQVTVSAVPVGANPAPTGVRDGAVADRISAAAIRHALSPCLSALARTRTPETGSPNGQQSLKSRGRSAGVQS